MVSLSRTLDLVAVVGLAGLSLVGAVRLASGALALVLALPLAVFCPGYAFVAALYPDAADDGGPTDPARSHGDGPVALHSIARFGLAVLASVAIVAFSALGLNFVVGVYGPPTLAAALCLTTVFALVALARRLRRPAESRAGGLGLDRLVAGANRYFVPGERSLRTGRPFEVTSTRGAALNLLLVVSLLALVASAGLATTVTGPEPFTEFYLTTSQNGNTTILDARGGVSPAERSSLEFVVTNHEHETVEYTVVVAAQDVSRQGGSVSVTSERTLGTYTKRVEPGGNWTHGVPQASGDRLVFRLYKGGGTGGEPDLRLTVWLRN